MEYFDYPLEQGLRHIDCSRVAVVSDWYFDYPLEQGLRQTHPVRMRLKLQVF